MFVKDRRYVPLKIVSQIRCFLFENSVLSPSYNYEEVLIISYQYHMCLIWQLHAHDFSNCILYFG